MIQMDVKYLDGIPEFFKYYCKYRLLRYQITARDVRIRILFYFYTYKEGGYYFSEYLSSLNTQNVYLCRHKKFSLNLISSLRGRMDSTGLKA